MIRENLENIPHFPLPKPYQLRWYRPGDEAEWTKIHIKSDRYNVFPPEKFAGQFGTDEELLKKRQCYLCDGDGSAVGTATAWFYDNYKGKQYGRIHWVAIMPAYQGKGLAKPMMTIMLERLGELGHVRACLGTNSMRLPAISLYMKFGFVPEIETKADRRIWRKIQEELASSR